MRQHGSHSDCRAIHCYSSLRVAADNRCLLHRWNAHVSLTCENSDGRILTTISDRDASRGVHPLKLAPIK